MREEGDEFFEDQSLLSFIILRVMLVRMIVVLCPRRFDGQRKQLIGLRERKHQIFRMPALLFQLRAYYISFPDPLVLQPIITQILYIQKHLLLPMLHALVPHPVPPAPETTGREVQRFLLRLAQTLTKVVVVLQLGGVVDEWFYLLGEVKLFPY